MLLNWRVAFNQGAKIVIQVWGVWIFLKHAMHLHCAFVSTMVVATPVILSGAARVYVQQSRANQLTLYTNLAVALVVYISFSLIEFC